MKKYKMLLKEQDEREIEIEANSYFDACAKIEEKIKNGEIVLDPYNYTREYENYLSKKIPQNFKMTVEYDAENETIKIETNEMYNEFPYCFDMRDLRVNLYDYCRFYLEDQDREYTEELEEEMERDV